MKNPQSIIRPVYLPGRQYAFMMLDDSMDDGLSTKIKKSALIIASLVNPFVRLLSDTSYVIINNKGVFVRHVVLADGRYIAYPLNSPKIEYFVFRRSKNIQILRINRVVNNQELEAISACTIKSNPLLID